tara:strand:+ start:97 stop:288 length:192 start_codon:yes stop_codon:yes gene_type:complete
MDYITPRQIISPYTGAPVKPKFVEYTHDGKLYKEAHYFCPDSGNFIQKGLVEVTDLPSNDKQK